MMSQALSTSRFSETISKGIVFPESCVPVQVGKARAARLQSIPKNTNHLGELQLPFPIIDANSLQSRVFKCITMFHCTVVVVVVPLIMQRRPLLTLNTLPHAV